MHVVTFAVVMNKDKWNALPDDVKKVIDDLRQEQALWTGTYVDDHVEEALEWSKEKYNLEIYTFSKEERQMIPGFFQPIIDDYIERTDKAGLDGKKILKDAKKLMGKYEKKYK